MSKKCRCNSSPPPGLTHSIAIATCVANSSTSCALSPSVDQIEDTPTDNDTALPLASPATGQSTANTAPHCVRGQALPITRRRGYRSERCVMSEVFSLACLRIGVRRVCVIVKSTVASSVGLFLVRTAHREFDSHNLRNISSPLQNRRTQNSYRIRS